MLLTKHILDKQYCKEIRVHSKVFKLTNRQTGALMKPKRHLPFSWASINVEKCRLTHYFTGSAQPVMRKPF